MEFLDLKHSDFANRVFCMLEYMRGWHVSGSCDFEAYVVSVWNICTPWTRTEVRDFVFELYDADESGYLDRGRGFGLGGYYPTEAFAGTERSALLLQDLVTLIAESPLEAISKEDFKEFTASRPALLGPGYQLEAKNEGEIRRRGFFWDWIVMDRVPAASRPSTRRGKYPPFVLWRRVTVGLRRVQKRTAHGPRAEPDQENIRHRGYGSANYKSSRRLYRRSMSMCTTVVSAEQAEPPDGRVFT